MQKRGLFLNKKSQLITRQNIIHLGMIGAAVLVLVLSLRYIKSIEKDTEFQKIFLNRDIALLINTIYSSPGEIEYVYFFDKLDLSKFKFEFKPQSATDDKPIIRVEDERLGKTFPYGKLSQSKYPSGVDSAKSIKFSKKDTELVVTKNE